jgi:arsenate reductase
MAEAILNHKEKGEPPAYSAGSKPTGTVHPEALGQLKSAGLSADNLRSKRWEEFAKSGAPKMDFVFTVCDNAANETCPLWPGQPVTAHGGVPDPCRSTRNSRAHYPRNLHRRINLLLCPPFASLDTLAIEQDVGRIGKQ